MKKQLIIIASLVSLLTISASDIFHVKVGENNQIAQAADNKLSLMKQAEKDNKLRLAVQKGLTAQVSSLLAAGANTEAKDVKYGMTPLMFASQPDVIKRLLAAGANTEAKNNDGLTPLMIASIDGNTEAIKLLLAAGANLEARDNNGITALMFASSENQAASIKLLLAAGARIDARNNNGITALMFASLEGKADAVKVLLEAGANLDARDNNGVTALMFASSEGKTDVANLLQEAGADMPNEVSAENPKLDIPLILLQEFSKLPQLIQQNNASMGTVQTYNTSVQNSTGSVSSNNNFKARLNTCESRYMTCNRGCSSTPSFGHDISDIKNRCYARCADNKLTCIKNN